MQEYLLFIDTETTGLPKKWTVGYAAKDNWPSAVQVAWIIFTKEGKEVKRENFYINENDISISTQAQRVHRIDNVYLRKHGVPRLAVMEKLKSDLAKFKPLVIGHFIALDVHVLGADFYRCALAQPFSELSLFCTMIASSKYVKKPWKKHLRLNELYQELFETELEKAHNALVDAEATARSYFELVKRKEITEEVIRAQQVTLSEQLTVNHGRISKSALLMMIFLLVGIIVCCILIF
ncbi:3'-5' exonuclease [Olivibacter sp. XZL3]|uniref:3'-5' exonuclease n=1 Tax=Olivibacter sp. XZL3 TaxID=1735116 RepID=UPI0014170819|nr:3'-5' exonuclease [Olivibacter sp. XZL3]